MGTLVVDKGPAHLAPQYIIAIEREAQMAFDRAI